MSDQVPPARRSVKQRLTSLGVRVFVGLANTAYAGFKLLPVRRKVTFITWNADRPSLDFRVLMERLRHLPQPPAVVALCRQLRRTPAGYARYAVHMLHQMYAMATSQVVVLDAYCILASALHHRPSLRVVQIWHALGAFKKFGWSVVDKSEGWAEQSDMPARDLARLLRMHAGYTDIAVSCAGAIPCFAEAFNADPAVVRIAWLPRADVLRDETAMAELRSRILAAHPELGGGRVVLYAPTLRRSSMNAERVGELAEAVRAGGWKLIVKTHAIRGETGESYLPDSAIDVPEFSAFELLALADAVITDYSAIVYEAYLRTIPVFFYAYDMAAYEEARGFYTPVSQFPAGVYTSAADLVRDMTTQAVDVPSIRAFTDIFLEDSPRRVDILDLIDPARTA